MKRIENGGQNILQRHIQGVAHMQASRDVGWRHHHYERLGFASGVACERAGGFPACVMLVFDGLGIESFI